VVRKNLKSALFAGSVFWMACFVTIYGQRRVEDFGNWYGAEFSYKIAKKTYLVGALSIRTRDNGLSLNRIHYEFGAEKRFFKVIDVGLKVRNRHIFNYDGYGVNQRLIWDVSHKQKFGDFGLQLRSRLQYTFREGINPLTERVRLKLDYKLEKDLRVYIYEEVFYRVQHRKGPKWSDLRFGFGAKYKINKQFSVDLSYIRMTELNKKRPEVMNVVQLELNFDF
jgi:hypothetical protein